MLQGTDLDWFRRLRAATRHEITAAGGITTIEDIKELAASSNIHAALGMAIYTGRLDLGAEIYNAYSREASRIVTAPCGHLVLGDAMPRRRRSLTSGAVQAFITSAGESPMNRQSLANRATAW